MKRKTPLKPQGSCLVCRVEKQKIPVLVHWGNVVQSNRETDAEPHDASSTDSLFKLDQYFKKIRCLDP